MTHTLGFTLQHAAAEDGEAPEGLLLAVAHLVKAGIVGLDAILGHAQPPDEAVADAAEAGSKVRQLLPWSGRNQVQGTCRVGE